MGHLINPIGFRLGHSLSWEDKWFVKSIYYPEYLHSVLKIRAFLYFFFNKKKIEKIGLIYSHFEIVKYNKNFIIKIMLYHSKYEALSDAFIVQNFLDFKGFIRKKEIWKKDSSWNLELSFSFMLLLIFWGFFFEIKKCLKVSKFLNQKLLKLINLKSRKFLKWYDSKNKSLLQSYLLKKKEFLLQKSKIMKTLKLKKQKYIRMSFVKKEKQKDTNEFVYKTITRKTLNPYTFFLFDVLSFLTMVKNLKHRYFFKYAKAFFVFKRNWKYFVNKSKFLIYCSMLKNLWKKIESLATNIKVTERILIEVWFNTLLNLKFLKPVFLFITRFLLTIFKYLTILENVCIRYFLISNKNITASFLSKYIARKLKRNFTLFQIINPLKQELVKLFNLGDLPNVNALNLNLKSKNIQIFYKGLFKRLHLLLNSFLNKELCIFIFKNKTLCNFTYFFFFFFKNKNINKKQRFNVYYLYLKNQVFLQLYYNINFMFYNKFLVSMFINKENLDFKEVINFEVFYEKSLAFFFNNLNFLIFQTKNLVFNSRKLFGMFYSLKNVIKYNYFVFNFNWFLKFNNINKFKIRKALRRNESSQNLGFLLGYKLGFKGRFTRKQRAASLWFAQGQVPLNSVMCKIDYGFYTLPLKNSAVSIKVWLYKNKNVYDWVYKIPFYKDEAKS